MPVYLKLLNSEGSMLPIRVLPTINLSGSNELAVDMQQERSGDCRTASLPVIGNARRHWTVKAGRHARTPC